MSILITKEKYGDDVFLASNVGDWIHVDFEFLHRVDYFAETQAKTVIYRNIGGVPRFELTDGTNWIDYGFVSGKDVTLNFHDDITSGVTVVVVTVDYADGDKLFLISAPAGAVDGEQWPVYSSSTGDRLLHLIMTQNAAPESMEYDFNLTNPSGPGFASVVDGSINRFKIDGISGMLINDALPFTQIGNKSGGHFGSVVNLTYLSINDNYRKYRVSYFFFNWTMLQNGFDEPQWFVGIDTLAPIHGIGVFSELNNPNSVLYDKSNNVNASLGGYNENYNTSINPFDVDNVIFRDSDGNVIEGIDYCNTTKFEIEITDNESRLNTTHSRFTIGLIWRPIDSDEYYENTFSFGQNTLALIPTQEFIHSVSPDPSTYFGNVKNSLRWNFTNLQFTITGTLLTVTGEIIPDPDNEAFFNNLDDGEKKHTLWISPYRDDIDANEQFRTSVKVYDQDVICAPALGEPIKSISEGFTDHAGLDLGTATTTTEDDVAYNIDFRLDEGVQYQGIRAAIQMYNTVTGEFFTLEEFFIGFSGVPFISGIYEVNETLNRNFNLPPGTDKNRITLNRLSISDIPGAYAVSLNYGFLDLWQYWELQNNADDSFFNVAEPQNGLNKDWQRYASDPDWTPRVSIFAVKNDVEDYHYSPFNIRPYEDEDVTTTCTYVDLSNNDTPTALIGDTLMEVTAVLTWNTDVFDPVNNWFAATIEDFEAGNRWLISSVLAHGGVSSNPLKPIAGQTLLDVNIAGNVATLKYIIDTNIVDASKVSLTHRVFTLPADSGKIMESGVPKLKEDGVNKLLEE